MREIPTLDGAEVRLSFDGRRSRIHAKAWLFHRETGFSSVWVGSAKLSGWALAGGLEWTMKASEADLRHVVEMFRGSFEASRRTPSSNGLGSRERGAGGATAGQGAGEAACRPRVPEKVELAIRRELAKGRGIHSVAKAVGVWTGPVQRVRAELALTG